MLKVFAVRDEKTQAFMQPVFFLTKPQAERWFHDVVNNPDEKIVHVHSEDFALWEVGEFDEVSGVLVQSQGFPVLVRTGAQSLNGGR